MTCLMMNMMASATEVEVAQMTLAARKTRVLLTRRQELSSGHPLFVCPIALPPPHTHTLYFWVSI